MRPPFWIGAALVVVWALLALRRLRIRLAAGEIRPGKVVSVRPGLVAVHVDLGRGSEPHPAIQVIPQPLARIAGGPPAPGTRVAVVTRRRGKRRPRRDAFEAVTVDCVTGSRAEIQGLLDSIPARGWLDLEEGLRQVPTPTTPGVYPVRYPTLYAGVTHGPYPAGACTVFSPRADYTAVLDVLRRVSPNVQVAGSEDGWSQVVAHGSRSRLTINALVPQGPQDRFSQVIAGMYHHFAAIPTEGTVNQQRVLAGLTATRLALGIVAEPGFEDEDAPFHAVFGLARRLGGLVFNGYGVMDSEGRVLLNGDGSFEAREEDSLPEAEGDANSGPK